MRRPADAMPGRCDAPGRLDATSPAARVKRAPETVAAATRLA